MDQPEAEPDVTWDGVSVEPGALMKYVPVSREDSPPAVEPELIVLHPDGDVILLVPGTDLGKRFLVSTAVLSITSPFFRVLLTSDAFQEGSEIKAGICPTVTLEEDDPDVMEILLSILHFKHHDEFSKLKPQMVKDISIHCDNYDCKDAMKPWVTIWLAVGDEYSVEDLLVLLSAAYLLRSADGITRITAFLIRQVDLRTASSWMKQEDEEIAEIPIALIGSVLDVQSGRRFKTDIPVCQKCGTTFQLNARQCRLCLNKDLGRVHCDKATRTHVLIVNLTIYGLWPSVKLFENKSAVQVVEVFRQLSGRRQHICSGGESCSIPISMKTLHDSGKKILEDVKGIGEEEFSVVQR